MPDTVHTLRAQRDFGAEIMARAEALRLQPGWRVQARRSDIVMRTYFDLWHVDGRQGPSLILSDWEIRQDPHMAQLKVLAWICKHAGSPVQQQAMQAAMKTMTAATEEKMDPFIRTRLIELPDDADP